MSVPASARLGVGVGWRPEAGRAILARLDDFEVLELLSDTVVGKGRRAWREARDLAELSPLVLHGVNLSLASVDCLAHRSYLRDLRRLASELRVPYYSEHFAFTKTATTRLGHLSPVWRTERQLAIFASNVAAVQEELGVPLVLENIAIPFEIPGAEMDETDFINETVRRAGCGILLDAENLAINAENFGYDPLDWLARLERRAVVQVHLAGGVRENRRWVDTHSRPVRRPVWDLYRRIVDSCPNLRCVIIERDEDIGPAAGLAAEAVKARRLWAWTDSRAVRRSRVARGCSAVQARAIL